jgi:uncharacterized protein (DUF1330 family)
MTVTLCCLLWARPGQGAELTAYEDTVLALMPDHGALVLQRLQGGHEPGDPTEIQVLQFPTEESFDGYMADPRRTALSADRDAAIERTQLMVVEPIPEF